MTRPVTCPRALLLAIANVRGVTPSWQLLREARKAAGLTQSQLAGRAGITQGAVAQLERPGSNPTVETLDGILRETGRRLRLVSEEDRPNVDQTLIARNLRMTPAERLAAFETAHRELAELRELAGAPDA